MSLSNGFRISTVILHYNDAEMTRKYINNLQSLNWAGIDHHIIVVDNASPDGSGTSLYEGYADSNIVDVILMDKNEGFARGNNAGIAYSVSNHSPELIIISNNDIIIEDKDLPNKIIETYRRTVFDVFGPDIYSTYRSNHQSPIREHYLSVEELNDRISYIDKTLRKLRVLDRLKLYEPLRSVKKSFNSSYPSAPNYDRYQENVVLQGAFFVLSRGYLEAYPDGLYPDTFLYMEEDILNYRIHKKNLKAVYDPDLKVNHLEGAATRKQSGNRCKKFIFELEQTRLSCLEMIKYINSQET